MVDTARRLKTNVEGPFYVNTRCINCDTCRQLAPETFAEQGNYSSVVHQPDDDAEKRRAYHALLSCPVAAIVSADKDGLQEAADDFPLYLEEEVYYCGYTSEKSFGGSSYFLRHPEGNWLIDSPRFVPHLARKFEEMGGIRYIFLTHHDDIADAPRYAKHFGAERIIHEHEKKAQPDAEILIGESVPFEWAPDFRIIPTPGHTRGHMVLLYRNKFLFTGDHLAWSRKSDGLVAFPDYCWYSWDQQLDSLARLAEESFEWILPGHGERAKRGTADLRRKLLELLERYGYR
ncbi:MAG: MBL fold metallo-hydrolase [Thermicanus sp.]|nr:MBL fold metallo-hydrolase [Thermicanus sp.]